MLFKPQFSKESISNILYYKKTPMKNTTDMFTLPWRGAETLPWCWPAGHASAHWGQSDPETKG